MTTSFQGSMGFPQFTSSSNPSSFTGSFGFPSVQRSLAYHGNALTITKARLRATGSGNVNFSLGLADNPDGNNITFEEVTPAAQHTFTTATGSWLYVQVIGDTGAFITEWIIDQIEES